MIERYESIHRSRWSQYLPIPPFYRDMLTRLNGGFLFETALFGIPFSMLQDPPLLNRSVQQPLDVCTANEHWRLEYGVPRTSFYFASGSHSSTDNVGYFLMPNNSIEAYPKGNKKIGEWATFTAFLTAEITRAEARSVEFERMLESMGSSKSKRKR